VQQAANHGGTSSHMANYDEATATALCVADRQCKGIWQNPSNEWTKLTAGAQTWNRHVPSGQVKKVKQCIPRGHCQVGEVPSAEFLNVCSGAGEIIHASESAAETACLANINCKGFWKHVDGVRWRILCEGERYFAAGEPVAVESVWKCNPTGPCETNSMSDYWHQQFDNAGVTRDQQSRICSAGDEWYYDAISTEVGAAGSGRYPGSVGSGTASCPGSGYGARLVCSGGSGNSGYTYGGGPAQVAGVKEAIENGGVHRMAHYLRRRGTTIGYHSQAYYW